jgi:CDP-diacylglycerol--glycerol-3-phosphate 3-phosphatidyltransferase
MDKNKHRLNIADIITLLRVFMTVPLLFLKPLTLGFFYVYALAGLTDVLDGWIARKTKTSSDFGARLDSIADLLFYAVMLLRILPILLTKLPNGIWYGVAVIFCIRISAYIVAAIKYRLYASLHTYLNKVTGFAVFLIPFSIATDYAVLFCFAVCVVAAASSLEELVIHIRSKDYRPNAKSIFYKQRL